MDSEAKIVTETQADPRPRSAVSTGVGLVGLAGLFAWVAVARTFDLSAQGGALVALLACGVPMVLWSLLVDKVHRRPSTGIDWSGPPRPLSEALDFSLVKIAGLWATWAGIGFLYCVGRWYWNGVYLFSMEVLGLAAAPLLVLSIPYVIWLDRRLVEPRDGAWHFGQLLIGKTRLVEREMVYEHLRCWAVKGFFMAFMIAIVPGNWAGTVSPAGDEITGTLVSLTRWLITAMFMIDTVFATVGYVLTMKPLDAHIRSANPHAAGWTAALICYPPFVLMGPGGPLDYHKGTMGENGWIHWLGDYPLLMAFIAFLLVSLTAVYAWATVAFGIRFSNLTHRGILTHGPYAWTKHPAYVSKNLFWWLATLPFFATTGNMTDMIRNSFVMALVAGVYYWRARTEERHLSADPDYRAYAEWMERNAPLPKLRRRLLAGRPEPAAVPAE